MKEKNKKERNMTVSRFQHQINGEGEKDIKKKGKDVATPRYGGGENLL